MAIFAQFDAYQMYHNLGTCWGCYPETWQKVEYARRFANLTSRLARTLAVGQRFIYSSTCQRHADSLTTSLFNRTLSCGDMSLESALVEFLEHPASLPKAIVQEGCDTIDCCC